MFVWVSKTKATFRVENDILIWYLEVEKNMRVMMANVPWNAELSLCVNTLSVQCLDFLASFLSPHPQVIRLQRKSYME